MCLNNRGGGAFRNVGVGAYQAVFYARVSPFKDPNKGETADHRLVSSVKMRRPAERVVRQHRQISL